MISWLAASPAAISVPSSARVPPVMLQPGARSGHLHQPEERRDQQHDPPEGEDGERVVARRVRRDHSELRGLVALDRR
jgi:hypothetical protein